MLTLRRNPDADQSESYNILFERRYVGRISYVGAGAPKDRPWFWGLECHEWQGSDRPQYGNVANLDAAKAAFRAAWEKGPSDYERAGCSSNFASIARAHEALGLPVEVTDAPTYQAYSNSVNPIIAKHGGKFIVRGGKTLSGAGERLNG